MYLKDRTIFDIQIHIFVYQAPMSFSLILTHESIHLDLPQPFIIPVSNMTLTLYLSDSLPGATFTNMVEL